MGCNLAPDSQEVGVVTAESLWDAGDGPDVLGHVLADLAVATRRGSLVDAVLVDNLDREAVELWFAEVLHVAVEAIADSAVELRTSASSPPRSMEPTRATCSSSNLTKNVVDGWVNAVSVTIDADSSLGSRENSAS